MGREPNDAIVVIVVASRKYCSRLTHVNDQSKTGYKDRLSKTGCDWPQPAFSDSENRNRKSGYNRFQSGPVPVFCSSHDWTFKHYTLGGLVDVDQFKRNLTKKSASGFINLLREAINGNNGELWNPVVTHDVFHTKIPNDPNDLTSSENQVRHKYQEEAVTESWKMPFIGDRVLRALEQHIIREKNKMLAYGPYCSIVQSSGMGKSHLLDEFSKNHFLIPVNLRRKETSGFPPPDNAIHDLLTQVDENGMFHFLVVLFKKTMRIITRTNYDQRGGKETNILQ
ncbi:hypothetical protein EDB89DRAFT_1914070 [Lactarius sanguifluus]|nr:hypothetical protein EDB89DRAFT_1914070 [Lactarius sanguifluus]